MSYRWVASPELPAAEADELGLTATFDDQAGAEQWLTHSYEQLSIAGVREVTLFEQDRLVYGPMSLEA